MLKPENIANLINRHFADSEIVHVSAAELYDDEIGNPETQIEVDIIPFLFERSIKGESDRDSALSAAVCDIESLPVIQSVKQIGWIDSDRGRGEGYLLTLQHLADWRIGSDGRFYRH